jgi:precorrin-6B methylase 2
VPYVMRLEDQRYAAGVANEYEDRVILDNGTIESLTCVTDSLEDLGVDDFKLLAIDKVYMLPSGQTIESYQPVLATTEQTMNNDFVIYGE